MGFFSSRKVETQDSFMETPEKSVVQSIRSRLYGKSKGKEREVISSPVASSPRLPNSSRLGDNLVPINQNLRPSGSLRSNGGGTSSQHLSPKSKSAASTSSRSTDPLTATLASRLNELAVSNREGLLNDEEYRLLRQSLFERFASGEVAPSEAPHVPASRPNRSSIDGRPSLSSQPRPPSQFHVDPARTPSLRTKPSMASTVSTLFRRASRRPSSSMLNSSAASDASSVFSMGSQRSNTLHRPTLSRGLSRKTSDTSIRTEISRAPYESLYNSRPNSATEQYLSPSRSTTRSLRRLAATTPPSSFPGRLPSADALTRASPSSIHMQDTFNDDNLQSAKEIRREMDLVEAEGRRLMDAFNGLELTTLTRPRTQKPRLPPLVTQLSDGSRSNTEDPTSSLSERKRHDMDAFSMRSNTSAGTTFSAAKSQHSRRLQGANKPVSLLRKSSFSSVSSSIRTGSATGIPYVPPLPPSSLSHINHIGIGSSSSVNLARAAGQAPLSSLAESEIVDRRSFAEARLAPGLDHEDAEIIALESELNDIRKRRGEVTARYEARLEYLRAKLKGAELHEKLLRK